MYAIRSYYGTTPGRIGRHDVTATLGKPDLSQSLDQQLGELLEIIVGGCTAAIGVSYNFV